MTLTNKRTTTKRRNKNHLHKHKIIIYPKSNNNFFYNSFKETAIQNGRLLRDNQIEQTNNPSLFLPTQIKKLIYSSKRSQTYRKYKNNKKNILSHTRKFDGHLNNS